MLETLASSFLQSTQHPRLVIPVCCTTAFACPRATWGALGLEQSTGVEQVAQLELGVNTASRMSISTNGPPPLLLRNPDPVFLANIHEVHHNAVATWCEGSHGPQCSIDKGNYTVI